MRGARKPPTRCLAGLAVIVASGCLAPAPDGAAPQAERPNIIFVFADDHAVQAVGAYGGRLAPLNPTPNIDRIANEGMLFRSAFVTNAICAPSRAVVLTGLHSHLNGVLTNVERFDGAKATFPMLLRASGYQTAVVGKWHLKSEPVGFDHWQVLPGQGAYYNPDFRTPQGTTRVAGYVTDLITDNAIEWLRSGRAADRPFMLMYQHKAPHRSWQPGPEHLLTYDGVEIPEPDTLFDDYAGRTSATQTQEMTIARHMEFAYDLKLWPNTREPEAGLNRAVERFRERLSPPQLSAWDAAYGDDNRRFNAASLDGDELVRWKYQRYMKDYLRTIRSIDDNLGRLLDYLDAAGLADNTVIVYSSDQGFFLGEHGWYDKRWMYEESLRVPLVVRWPAVIAPGTENHDLVQNLDFAQTFLDMAGVRAPEHMQGRSLVPLLRGATPADWRDAIYYEYFEFPGAHAVQRHYGVRTARHKLIHYPDISEWELFDLATDADELSSLHQDPAYAEVRAGLAVRLAELRLQYAVAETAETDRD